MGLTWQLAGSLQSLRIETIPKTAGIYKILDFSTGRLLYIGESGFLRSRLRSHARAPWVPFQPIAWFHELGLSVPSYQRHELESDLLGAYFSTYGAPPAFQYVRREAVLKGPG